MKLPETPSLKTLRRLTLVAAATVAGLTDAPGTPARAADPAQKPSSEKSDDPVVESGPFVVTEKSLGVIPLNGTFRYSRFSQRVKTPVFISGPMLRGQPLATFQVNPGDQIHAVNGQEIVGLTKTELIKLWMETGDAGDPLTLVIASPGAKGRAFRELKIKRVSPHERQETPTPDSPEIQAIIESSRTKQHRDETDFSEEFSALDALLAKHGDAKTEEAAQIVASRAILFAVALRDFDAALKVLAHVKTAYLGTKAARDADQQTTLFEKEKLKQETPAVRALIGRPASSIDFIWSTRPGLKNLGNLKGKVVILCFWTTSSRQSVYALQHLKFIADYYKHAPVEVVSVTSLLGYVVGPDGKPIDARGKPDKEMGLLKKYAEEKALTWPVVLSKQPAMNPDYALQQIPSLTIIAPDGTIRENGLNPMMPLRIKIDPLLREFKLPTSAADATASAE